MKPEVLTIPLQQPEKDKSMSPTVLTIYTLVWPLIVAGVLFVLVSAFWKEWRKSRSKGRSLI